MGNRSFFNALHDREGDFLLATVLEGRAQGERVLLRNTAPVWPEELPAFWGEHLPALAAVTSSGILKSAGQRIFVERFGAAPQLVVCGGGHVGASVVRLAKLLGLPVKHLVVASDKNNVLFDFLTSGTYNRQRPFFQTISPSMDILISSNLERMLYYMSDKDTRLISMLMNDLNQWGAYEVPEPMMKKIRSIFGTGWADENQVREMIADCWNKNHYVIDPHTACGYYVMQQMPRDPLTPRVLLSTASPYKFPRVVNESLGLDASGTDFECMDVLAKATGTTAPAALRGLETADVRFDHVVDIDGMEGFVEQAAKAL